MSIYSRDDERAIRAQRLVRDWAASGLVSAEQRDRIDQHQRELERAVVADQEWQYAGDN